MVMPTDTETIATVCRYRSAEGVYTLLVLAQDRHGARGIAIDGTVTQRKLARDELRWLTPLADYQPRRAAKKMLAAGRVLGITPTARRALHDLLAATS